jgi:transposase InsO family protein
VKLIRALTTGRYLEQGENGLFLGLPAHRTRAQAKADVFDYIERFSNPRRRHSALGYLNPMEFERGDRVRIG